MVIGDFSLAPPFVNRMAIEQGEMNAMIRAAARGYLMKLPSTHTASPVAQWDIQSRIRLEEEKVG